MTREELEHIIRASGEVSMNTTHANACRAGPPTSISDAQSVATRSVAMMLKGHHC